MNPNDAEIIKQILENLEKNSDLKRKHASYWNYYKKNAKEMGLFSEVFNRIQSALGSNITDWNLCQSDPPDIWVQFDDGRKIGIEITELVNQAAIESQIRGSDSYNEEIFRFDPIEACTKVHEIVIEKSSKTEPRLSDYEGLYLLIHTDEILLNSQEFIRESKDHLKLPENIFNSIFLLFSYEPQRGESPLINLSDDNGLLEN